MRRKLFIVLTVTLFVAGLACMAAGTYHGWVFRFVDADPVQNREMMGWVLPGALMLWAGFTLLERR